MRTNTGPRNLLLAVALLSLLVLPGCTDLLQPGAGDGTDGATLSEAEARQAWQSAFANVDTLDDLDAIGIDVSASADGEGVFAYEIKVRPGDGAFLARISIAPRLLEEGGSGVGASATQLFGNLVFGQEVRDGVAYTVAPNITGVAKVRRDHVPEDADFTSFSDLDRQVFPGGDEGTPAPTDGPSIGPDFGLLGLNDQGGADELRIASVEATTHKGRAAWRIAFSFMNATMEVDGEVIVYDDPRLPARAAFDLQFPEDAPGDHPLFEAGSARLVAEFTYDDEVEVTLPDAERAPVSISKEETVDWDVDPGVIEGSISPSHEQEVPLAEVELRVGTAQEGGGFGGFGFGSQEPPEEVHFSMRADAGEEEQGGVRAVYADADGDGFLSANDTYRVEVSDDVLHGNVSLYWFDLWAGLYEFQPGFGALAAVGALSAAGAVAVVLRKRRDQKEGRR